MGARVLFFVTQRCCAVCVCVYSLVVAEATIGTGDRRWFFGLVCVHLFLGNGRASEKNASEGYRTKQHSGESRSFLFLSFGGDGGERIFRNAFVCVGGCVVVTTDEDDAAASGFLFCFVLFRCCCCCSGRSSRLDSSRFVSKRRTRNNTRRSIPRVTTTKISDHNDLESSVGFWLLYYYIATRVVTVLVVLVVVAGETLPPPPPPLTKTTLRVIWERTNPTRYIHSTVHTTTTQCNTYRLR